MHRNSQLIPPLIKLNPQRGKRKRYYPFNATPTDHSTTTASYAPTHFPLKSPRVTSQLTCISTCRSVIPQGHSWHFILLNSLLLSSVFVFILLKLEFLYSFCVVMNINFEIIDMLKIELNNNFLKFID